MKQSNEILVYITSDENRVLGGNPLALLIKNVNDQKEIVADLGRALRANVVQLKNGDYILITSSD